MGDPSGVAGYLGLALTFVWALSFIVGRPEDEVHVKSKFGLLKAALGGSIDENELATASA